MWRKGIWIGLLMVGAFGGEMESQQEVAERFRKVCGTSQCCKDVEQRKNCSKCLKSENCKFIIRKDDKSGGGCIDKGFHDNGFYEEHGPNDCEEYETTRAVYTAAHCNEHNTCRECIKNGCLVVKPKKTGGLFISEKRAGFDICTSRNINNVQKWFEIDEHCRKKSRFRETHHIHRSTRRTSANGVLSAFIAMYIGIVALFLM